MISFLRYKEVVDLLLSTAIDAGAVISIRDHVNLIHV